MELDYYRNNTLPETDRAEWMVEVGQARQPIRARLGPFALPVYSGPTVRIVNLTGICSNTRNVAALELPAGLFDKARFKPGDKIELAPTFFTPARADHVEWKGTFTLRDGSRL